MSTHRTVVVVLLVLVLMAGLVTSAQEAQVESAEALTLPSSVGLRVFPAPDGRHFSFESAVRLNGHIDRFMCVADSLSDADPLCLEPLHELPRGFDPDARSPHLPVGWAPDSSKLAVVGQPLLTGSDTDLWVMDLETASWATLTDDGYEGALSASEGAEAPPAGVSIEMQPAWSPDGTSIAVEQTITGNDGAFLPSTLSLVDVESGKVTELVTLPGGATQLAAGATTGITWSSDGAALAFSLRHREPDIENDGVWLLDVETGELAHLLDSAAIEIALHTIYPEVVLTDIGPVSWSPDGARLLLWAGDAGSSPVAIWAFWVNLGDQSIVPVPLPAHDSDTGARRRIWPLQATWNPEGNALLVVSNGTHPNEDTVSLDPANSRARLSVRLIDVVTAEGLLLGGLPAGQAVPFYLAAWGVEGDVILNGYHLKLIGG